MDNVWTYEYTNVRQILDLPKHSCVKCVFNGWYQVWNVQIMNEQIFPQFPLLSHEMLNFWCGYFEEF